MTTLNLLIALCGFVLGACAGGVAVAVAVTRRAAIQADHDAGAMVLRIGARAEKEVRS